MVYDSDGDKLYIGSRHGPSDCTILRFFSRERRSGLQVLQGFECSGCLILKWFYLWCRTEGGKAAQEAVAEAVEVGRATC
jgi:hypothetical protein